MIFNLSSAALWQQRRHRRRPKSPSSAIWSEYRSVNEIATRGSVLVQQPYAAGQQSVVKIDCGLQQSRRSHHRDGTQIIAINQADCYNYCMRLLRQQQQ